MLWEQAQSEGGFRVSGKGHGQEVSLRVRSRLWEQTQEGCVWKKKKILKGLKSKCKESEICLLGSKEILLQALPKEEPRPSVLGRSRLTILVLDSQQRPTR